MAKRSKHRKTSAWGKKGGIDFDNFIEDPMPENADADEAFSGGDCPPEEYFSQRNVAPLDASTLFVARFGYKKTPKCAYEDCEQLIEGATGETIGVLPRLPLSRVWTRACAAMGDRPFGLSVRDWNAARSALTQYIEKRDPDIENSDTPMLVQDIFSIGNLEYLELCLPNARKIIQLIDAAVKEDIADSVRVAAKWHKIKRYPHKVALEEENGGIFNTHDTVILRQHGIRSLNDLRKRNVYFLKNLLLEHECADLPEEINAAYKADLERRRDFRYKVYPYLFGIPALAFSTVVGNIYMYTLLKNLPMTIAIIASLALWAITIAYIIKGATRVKKRRKVLPDFKYFTKPVKGIFSFFVIFSVYTLTAVTVFYERYDGYDDQVYYRNLGAGQPENIVKLDPFRAGRVRFAVIAHIITS